ncbi:hypothetical protein Tsubulata_022664 [Turnera subulata]|uniref:DUF4378 domain-containing protein n=1 Tax=Turnera subulata TaxID=218843 RepID=A0A9Q0F674_9ROSI|nr:hypothetical protein Tsubulata_022664 [Turnera subulata]
MNEATGVAASGLAITEKKAQRPGGCVGIFFQLFDWNRRFAKKKLFSKRLLPPARTKQASKKFGGDEKMPKTKLHLIADENNGGFPNVMKNGIRCNGEIVERKHEMQAPGLVARLMGLESLPAVHRDKHRKATNSAACDGREERFVNSHNDCDREDMNLDKGNLQVESRPQKLQKTGQFERRTVTRFGAEALQIKSVLSRSRKHHPHKLTSPVKSPRISASKNVSRAARLIDAATRILEPSLQATNRAKCALTYSTSVKYGASDDTLSGGAVSTPPDVGEEPQNNGCYTAAVGNSFTGQTSCRNCGNLLDVVDSITNMEELPFAGPLTPSVTVNTSSQGSGRIKSRPMSSSPEQGTDALCHKNSDQPSASGKQENMQASSEPNAERNLLLQERQGQKQLRSQQCRPGKDDPSSIGFKEIHAHNEMPVGRDRTVQRTRLSNLQSRRNSSSPNAATRAKDSVASNRSLNGRRPRASVKTNNLINDSEKQHCGRRDDSFSQIRPPMRKRRTANAQVEGIGYGNTMPTRQRNVKRDLANGKESGFNGRSIDHTRGKARAASQLERNRASGNKNNEVISFTFNSPMGQKTPVSRALKERIDQVDKTITCHRQLVLDENGRKNAISLSNNLPLTGDALGMILEQKLRELTSQEEDETTHGGAPPKRSAAVILQELISALTSVPSEQSVSAVGPALNGSTPFQERKGSSFRCSHDGDHLSPGSVLEASFSNDSCISSSMDDSAGCRLAPDSMDYSHYQPKQIESDSELLDSATSVHERRPGSNMVTDLLNHISTILQSINLAGGRLTSSKFFHAKEVILNAELVFGNLSSSNSDRVKRLLICPFLLDELETLGAAMWINLSSLLSFEENKGSDQLRRFLFDCVIECLDSKYGRYCNTGFKAWRRVPKSMDAEMLIGEIGEEVRRWTNLLGMIPDEIIEWEMSHSLGKWTDFEVEAFETGAEIDREILQALVDEIVTDLRN